MYHDVSPFTSGCLFCQCLPHCLARCSNMMKVSSRCWKVWRWILCWIGLGTIPVPIYKFTIIIMMIIIGVLCCVPIPIYIYSSILCYPQESIESIAYCLHHDTHHLGIRWIENDPSIQEPEAPCAAQLTSKPTIQNDVVPMAEGIWSMFNHLDSRSLLYSLYLFL